jgi:hypothetical protein
MTSLTLPTKALCQRLLLPVALAFFCSTTTASTFISADHSQFLYTGRVDFSNAKSPSLSWPGTSIKANFSGKSLTVVLDDSAGKNFFNVIIDGKDTHPFVLQTKQGEHSYLISNSLTEGPHNLEIYKRTEGAEGASQFKGLQLANKASLLTLPQRPERRMEIYGDSISSGAGNEAADNGEDDLASEKNNYLAYGAIAARALNAELHTISQSGIGVMISWFDFTMPQFYDQLSAVGNNNSSWDFSSWTPHLVLINLMQNDKWLIDNEKRLQPLPNDEQRIAAYQQFIQTIRSKYPKAQIICALGSMDATETEKWPNYVRQAVKNLQKQGDTQLDTLFFPFTGYGQHPRVAQHQANANQLTAFIREKMQWH